MGVFRFKKGIPVLAIAGLACSGLSTGLSAEILRGAAGNPGAASHASITVFSKIGTSIQINDSQTLTKTILKLGLNQLDVTPTVPVIYKFLTEGSRMYRKISGKAKEASTNVRGILG